MVGLNINTSVQDARFSRWRLWRLLFSSVRRRVFWYTPTFRWKLTYCFCPENEGTDFLRNANKCALESPPKMYWVLGKFLWGMLYICRNATKGEPSPTPLNLILQPTVTFLHSIYSQISPLWFVKSYGRSVEFGSFPKHIFLIFVVGSIFSIEVSYCKRIPQNMTISIFFQVSVCGLGSWFGVSIESAILLHSLFSRKPTWIFPPLSL